MRSVLTQDRLLQALISAAAAVGIGCVYGVQGGLRSGVSAGVFILGLVAAISVGTELLIAWMVRALRALGSWFLIRLATGFASILVLVLLGHQSLSGFLAIFAALFSLILAASARPWRFR